MTMWERIPFQETPDYPLHRYRGCRVKVQCLSGTVVVGKFLCGNNNFIDVEGVSNIRVSAGDLLWFDLDGKRPKPEWSAEEKRLAQILYEAVPRSMSWAGTNGLSTRIDFLKMAREAIAWCDSPKMSISSADPESDDLDGKELQLAVAKKLAEQRYEAWDIAVHDGNDKEFMGHAQQIIDLVNREQGTG